MFSHCGNRSWVPVRCVSFSKSVNVSSNKVSVVVVFVKNTFKVSVLVHVSCPVCHKLVALVLSKS